MFSVSNFIVCKLFLNKAILKKKTGISGKQQPKMVDFHLIILFQSESLWSFLLFSTLRLFQSCHGLFIDLWAKRRFSPWGRGQVYSFRGNPWVLQVPDSWRLALSCLLNNEKLSKRKQENWKLWEWRHWLFLLTLRISSYLSQWECLARTPPKSNSEVRVWAKQICFVQEGFLHFPPRWTLHTWLRASVELLWTKWTSEGT